MKALKLLTLLCLTYNFAAFANEKESDLDAYLSDNKKLEFNFDYSKNDAEASKLHDSWIAPIKINYNYSRSKPYENEQYSESAAIKMTQPIFKSGGIYYGIKYANASKVYNDLNIDVAKRKMIKDTISLLMQIQQAGFKVEKQKLQIKNSDINLLQKKEQYLNGQLDSGFLNDAIIQRNIVKQSLYDLQTAKEKLITQFKTISDLDYRTLTVPHLEYITNDKFIENNIVLNKSKAEVEQNKYYKHVTIAKYLPTLNFTAGYNWTKTAGQGFVTNGAFIDTSSELNYYDYGLSATWSLDINTFRDIESTKIDYLKSQVVAKDKERELNSLFEQVMHNIENFDKKIALSQENKELYATLLEDTKVLYKAGYKTEYDVDNLSNSLEIQIIDSKIFDIDKQIELLSLYEMYVNNGK